MADRRPKGIDEGEDRASIRHISQRTMNRWNGAREDLNNPDLSNAMLRSEVGRAMVAAKHKHRDEVDRMNRDKAMVRLSKKFDSVRISEETRRKNDWDSPKNEAETPGTSPTNSFSVLSCVSTARLFDTPSDKEESPEPETPSPLEIHDTASLPDYVSTARLFDTPSDKENMPEPDSPPVEELIKKRKSETQTTNANDSYRNPLADIPTYHFQAPSPNHTHRNKRQKMMDEVREPELDPIDVSTLNRELRQIHQQYNFAFAKENGRPMDVGHQGEADRVPLQSLPQNRPQNDVGLLAGIERLEKEREASRLRRLSRDRDLFHDTYMTELERLYNSGHIFELLRTRETFGPLLLENYKDVGEVRYRGAIESLCQIGREARYVAGLERLLGENFWVSDEDRDDGTPDQNHGMIYRVEDGFF